MSAPAPAPAAAGGEEQCWSIVTITRVLYGLTGVVQCTLCGVALDRIVASGSSDDNTITLACLAVYGFGFGLLMALASLNTIEIVKKNLLWPFLFLDYYMGRGLFAVFTSIFYFTVNHWATYTTGGVTVLAGLLSFIVSCFMTTGEGHGSAPN